MRGCARGGEPGVGVVVVVGSAGNSSSSLWYVDIKSASFTWSVYLLGDIMSSVPLKYPACDRRDARDRRVVAGGKCRGGDNEEGTFIPLLLIILLHADNNCGRSAASGHKVGASSRAAGAGGDNDGGGDVVFDSCVDGTGEGVVVKPKPTRVDWDLGCFFFITGFPEITVKYLFEFGDGRLNHSVGFLRNTRRLS